MNPATGLLVQNGAVAGVRTASGDITAGVVVNAAGPWARQVGEWGGLNLPIQTTSPPQAIRVMS